MIISHKYKFIFIAVPKTGTTSIRNFLQPYCDVFPNLNSKSPQYVHTNIKILEQHFKNKNWNFDEYFKFGFVRNPWDRAVSEYHYKIDYADRGKLNQPYYETFMLQCERIKKINNFNKAVALNLLNGSNQLSYMSDDNQKNLMNFIGRFENINQDFKFICKKIGLEEKNLPHENKSLHKYYKEYYNEKSIQFIQEKFKEDIETFDYKF
jgi:hypothetical protein